MISALLYLQYHSIKNHTVMRIKRLKQPKYLLGAVVGGLYFYWYLFRTNFGTPRRGQSLALLASPDNQVLFESIGALALLIILLLAWVIPHQRAALTFTEAEVAYLFPAPISRRTLIHFKLLRSQTAILFTTLLLTLLTNRLGGHAWIRAAGYWLILSTVNLHLLGSSFAVTMLLDRGISTWQRRLGILALAAVLIGAVVIWGRQTLPAFDLGRVADLKGLRDYVQQVLAAGPAPYLLYPFRLVVRPFLASNALAFLSALGPALVLMLLHYAWVVRSNVAFEEASVQASQKLAEKLALVRSGNWQAANRKPRSKRPPFKLRPTGPPAVALLWKNLISAGQAFSLRIWISLAVFAVCATLGMTQASGGSRWRTALGMLSGMMIIWSVLVGPQLLRQDFRQDLPLADLLKTYPLRSWQLALGELLAPVSALTCIQWILLMVMLGLFWQSGGAGLGRPEWLGLGFGAALLLPMLNLIILQIPNAAALAFPAWFQSAKGAAQGIEATGQRLIFMIGQLLVLLVALVPAAALFAGVLFLGKMMLATAIAIPLASIAAALVLAAEAAFGVMLLGWLFDRFDVSAEQTS
ncbi:MAG: putative ABC exporter domain-containing protein [Limisphaerales bacterium]